MLEQNIKSQGVITIQVLDDTADPQFSREFRLQAPGVEGYVLGRSDSGSQYLPDVDLAPFGAQEKGISRRHAVLVHHHGEVHIVDLGSMNGTFLNGRRLSPRTAYVLKDGDQFSLANLDLIISQSR